jgi:pilus assembly protein Flp/PilA
MMGRDYQTTLKFGADLGEPTMDKIRKQIRNFIRAEDGPTAVEYAVMLAMIIVVCLAAVRTLGTNAKTTFTNISNSIGS